jgi:diadenylate cyclase
MTALNWMMMVLINNGALVLIVLFQPELRKALESLGRNRFMTHGLSAEETERQSALREIVTCLQDLSRRRVGALIVIERSTGLQDIIETGTAVDARISAPLLENIFEPNTPLHDGAVIIRDLRVVSAACILPLTESDTVSRDLGTRHRASIGISETTDAVALIVSEETGIMSYARNGKITRHLTEDSLRQLLQGLFGGPNDDLRVLIRREMKRIRSLGKGVRGHE